MNHRDQRIQHFVTQIRNMIAMKHAKNDAQPQQIVPNLYLGSIGAAMNKAILQELGITHIFTIAENIEPHHPDDFVYKVIEILDAENSDILGKIPSTVDAIANLLSQGQKVLVHCFAGKSRSATIVMAYLIKHKRMSVSEALYYCKQKRSIVCPNRGFMAQLRVYELSQK